MPTYEYRCSGCGKIFEVRQKFSEAPLETHAECGGKVERLISAPAFQFKGTGWYATDYAKGSSKSESKSENKSTETKTDSKSVESKPSETKTESKSETPKNS